MQHSHCLAADRTVARGVLEFCPVGRVLRNRAHTGKMLLETPVAEASGLGLPYLYDDSCHDWMEPVCLAGYERWQGISACHVFRGRTGRQTCRVPVLSNAVLLLICALGSLSVCKKQFWVFWDSSGWAWRSRMPQVPVLSWQCLQHPWQCLSTHRIIRFYISGFRPAGIGGFS